jgi:hypothetical protein
MLNGALLYNLRGHSSEIKCIDFSQKLQVLVSFDSQNLMNIHNFMGVEEPRLIQSVTLGNILFNAMTVGR